MNGGLKAAVVLHPDERQQAVVIWLMGGEDMKEWLPLLIENLQRYSNDMGYGALQALVRPGLARRLKNAGWTTEHISMRLEQ